MTGQGFLRPFSNPTLRAVWDKIERLAIEWCANSDVAKKRETELIARLDPLLNRNGKLQTEDGKQFGDTVAYRTALAEANGDKGKTASILGMSRATLYRRLGRKA